MIAAFSKEQIGLLKKLAFVQILILICPQMKLKNL